MGFRDIMLITHAHVGPVPPNKLHFRELFYAQEIDLPSMREELEHATEALSSLMLSRRFAPPWAVENPRRRCAAVYVPSEQKPVSRQARLPAD